jgi:tetratricopeptide (TPR) repeat protein
VRALLPAAALRAAVRCMSAGETREALTSMNSLALVLDDKGQRDKAEALFRRTLEALQGMLGPEHIHTLNLVNNLAVVLEKKGRKNEAEALYRRVLEAQERTLGREHLSTLLSVNNLAAVLVEGGRLDEARRSRGARSRHGSARSDGSTRTRPVDE